MLARECPQRIIGRAHRRNRDVRCVIVRKFGNHVAVLEQFGCRRRVHALLPHARRRCVRERPAGEIGGDLGQRNQCVRAHAPSRAVGDHHLQQRRGCRCVALLLAQHIDGRERHMLATVTHCNHRALAAAGNAQRLITHHRRGIIDPLARAEYRKPTDLRTGITQRDRKCGRVPVADRDQGEQRELTQFLRAICANGTLQRGDRRRRDLRRPSLFANERFDAAGGSVSDQRVRIDKTGRQRRLRAGRGRRHTSHRFVEQGADSPILFFGQQRGKIVRGIHLAECVDRFAPHIDTRRLE